MDGTRPILYGVADYAEIRRANAWFVDRTAKTSAALPFVTLHRLVMVFHGGECVVSEEV